MLPICERIAREIRNQYTLTYAPTNPKYDGKYRFIEVKAGASGRERLMVRTCAGYYAPLKLWRLANTFGRQSLLAQPWTASYPTRAESSE